MPVLTLTNEQVNKLLAFIEEQPQRLELKDIIDQLRASQSSRDSVSPSVIKRRLQSWITVAQAVIDGLDGKPFSWTNGEWESYRWKAGAMGVTLVSPTWLKKQGYRLKRPGLAASVGSAYFKSPISNTGRLFVLECQAVKGEE